MTARTRVDEGLLNAPRVRRLRLWPRRDAGVLSGDRFGRATEGFARAMGTPAFLIGMTVFIIVWMAWNTMAPETLRFDSADLGFTALTLVLSLQASYAAPLLLLAQNRQDDRDRVQIEQDRQRSARNLADTEYLAREVVALRLAISDLASERFVRDELRDQLEDLTATITALREQADDASGAGAASAASAAERAAGASGAAAAEATPAGDAAPDRAAGPRPDDDGDAGAARS
ncbi:MAG: DUF1003 domain-containing protein [Pseudoclavibacter caeni]|jgi:uncharacterized membrane protein